MKMQISGSAGSGRQTLAGILAVAGGMFLAAVPGANAQTSTAGVAGGAAGSSKDRSSGDSSAAVTSNLYKSSARSSFPPPLTTSYYAGRSRFTEPGSGYYRPYTLAPRPVYRTEIGVQPVRRNTFSLGYVSFGGYGSYYY